MSTSNYSLSDSTYNLNHFSQKFINASLYEKNERLDWDKIISNLKLNGFDGLTLKYDENDNLYFDKSAAITLRCIIFDLLNENVKSKTKLRDCIATNEKLKSQLEDNRLLARRYEDVVRNLNDNLLETKQQLKMALMSKKGSTEFNKINDVNGLNPSEWQHVNVGALEESRQIIVSRYHNLERICDEQRREINALQLKLTKSIELEKVRNQRQRVIFHQLRNKAPNCYNALDKRLLDVIETYETKVLQLETHLTFFSNLGFSLPDDDAPLDLTENNSNSFSTQIPCPSSEISNKYKQLIKKLQEEIENIQKEKELIMEKCELIKLESDSKPSMQEMKEVLNKLKNYKRLLEIHNIRPENEKKMGRFRQDSPRNSNCYPDSIQDIEFLPLKSCQKYLLDFCTTLNVKSIGSAFDSISDLLKMNTLYPTFFAICSRLLQLIATPGLPVLNNDMEASYSEKALSEARYSKIIDTMEVWVHHLCSVDHLLNGVEHLQFILTPWRKSKHNSRSGIFAAIDIVDDLIDQCMPPVEKDKEQIVLTYGHAKNLVEHFQKLFDCPQIIGIYSRMNVVYSKFSEMQNVLDSLKKILNIEDQRGLACLVAEVSGLDQMLNDRFRKEADRLEFTKDIEVLIRKLEKYEIFVPEFEKLVDSLINLLGLSSIDEILPRIRALQDSARVNQ